MTSRRWATPTLALLGATVAISFSAVFIRLARDDAATIVWLRMSMAAVILLPFALRDFVSGRIRLNRRDLVLTIVSGFLLAGHFLLWTASLQLTSIAASVLLVSMHPVAVIPLSAVLLGERTPKTVLLGVGISLVGTAVTCIGDFRLSPSALGGDLLALAGAACLAGYIVIGRGTRHSISVTAYSSAVYAIVALIAAGVAAVQGLEHFPAPRAALFAAGLAIVCTLGGHTVYNLALRSVPALTVSVAFLGEAPLVCVIGVLVLSTIPNSPTIIGGVTIIAGVALVVLTSARSQSAAVALE